MSLVRITYRDSLGAAFNEGARLVWAAMEKNGETFADVARRVGAKGGMVSRWLYGDRRPTADYREKFLQEYGIAQGLWSKAPDPKAAFVLPAVARRTGTDG